MTMYTKVLSKVLGGPISRVQGWTLVSFSELFKLVCNFKECRHPDIFQIGFCVCVWDEKNLENLPIMGKGKR